MGLSEEELLRRFVACRDAGDGDGALRWWGDLVEANFDRVRGMVDVRASRYGLSADERQEAVQRALVKLWHKMVARPVGADRGGERSPMAVQDEVAVIYAATNGFVDRVEADTVPDFDAKLVERPHAAIPEVMDRIGDGDWSDDTQNALHETTAEFARDTATNSTRRASRWPTRRRPARRSRRKPVGSSAITDTSAAHRLPARESRAAHGRSADRRA